MAWTAPRTWVTGEVPDAALLNLHLRDNLLYLLGETAWTAPAFTNAWVNFGSGYTTAGYRRIGDMVWLKGLIKSGAINTAAFTLPAGYRPPANGTLIFAAQSNNALGLLVVHPTGAVTPAIGSNAFFQLDGVVFSTI